MNSLQAQLLLDGLSAGAIYAALALSLVLIYRATRIVNFGQGEMATFSAFLAYQLMQWGWPAYLALPVVAAAAFLLGAVVFRLILKPLLGAPTETLVVATLGLFIVFQALSLLFWGSDQREFVRVFSDRSWDVLGVHITAFNIGVIASVTAIGAALTALFRLTKAGLAMRAAAAEREKSPLVGIPVERTLLIGWGLASMIGFLAAALVAPKIFLSPSMMAPVLLYSLAAATMGGWESAAGAILSGLLVGLAESVGSIFIPGIGAELRLAIPVVLMLFVLLIKPAGLFGKAAMVRA